MLDQTARTQAWHTEFAAIQAEIEANGFLAPRPAPKRTRKHKPLWEE